MSLSDKMQSGVKAWEYTKSQKGKSLPCFIDAQHVKQFIKELKEGLKEGYDCVCDVQFTRLIDELAGEGLI